MGIASPDLNRAELQEVAAMIGLKWEDVEQAFDLSDTDVIKLRVQAASQGRSLTAADLPGFEQPMQVDPRLLGGMLNRDAPGEAVVIPPQMVQSE